MVFVAIQHILERVVALQLVAFDAPDHLQIFFGRNEDFEVETLTYLFIVKHKKAFHDNHRRGLKFQEAGFLQFIVEGVFLTGISLTLDQLFQVSDEAFLIDR